MERPLHQCRRYVASNAIRRLTERKLAPEQQEKVLAARERMMAEAMSPQHVVTVSRIWDFEGDGETIKPHLKERNNV